MIGSDITYNKDHIHDLLSTLTSIDPTVGVVVGGREKEEEEEVEEEEEEEKKGAAEVYIGHLERGDEHGFFKDLEGRGFEVEEVYKENVAEGGVAKSLIVHVFRAVRRRKEEKEEEGKVV